MLAYKAMGQEGRFPPSEPGEGQLHFTDGKSEVSTEGWLPEHQVVWDGG